MAPAPDPVAVVTGASRGLGRAIALELAGRGYRLVVNYRRDAEAAEQTCGAIRAAGGSADPWPADVADPAQVRTLFAGVLKTYRRLDVLVNNAAVTRDELLPVMRPQAWREVLEINLHGVFHCCKAAAAPMCAAGRGVIVNIGSSSALSARPGQVNYSSTKSALLGFTKSLARELAGKGVRVLVIAPGFAETPLTDALPADTARRTLGRIPLGRWARPGEIARATAFFVSDAAALFTGQCVVIDGGRTALEQESGLDLDPGGWS